MHRPTRTRPATALLPATLLTALILAVQPAASQLRLVQAEEVGSFGNPQARAASLALPVPQPSHGTGHDNCTIDLTDTYPSACFPSVEDAQDYVRAKSHKAGTSTTVEPAGFGGTSASTSGAPVVGRTCALSSCTGSSDTWWSPTGANCTHAYPSNDYYRNNVSSFRYADNLAAGVGALNCNRMVLYRDGGQGGAGALDCGSATRCGDGNTYASLSWHNG